MNLNKFMCETTKLMLKSVYDSKTKPPTFFRFSHDTIAVTNDGVMAIIIPEREMIFNAEIRSKLPCATDWHGYEKTRFTGNIHLGHKVKGKVYEFDYGYGLNEKYMAYFNRTAEYRTNRKGTFIVLENGIPVGIIMGIDMNKLKEEKKND